MDVKLAYLGRSGVTTAGGGRTVNLRPNLSREPVAFDAELRYPLRFREAISALHDVVVSDLRYHGRDRNALERHREAERERLEALRQETLTRERRAMEQANRAVPPELEREHGKAVKRYWKARDAFNRALYQQDRGLWMILDPVITVADDGVFFECFSGDESSYGCLTVARDGGFGPASAVLPGTTNVDYSWELYNHFQGLRSYRQTRFSVDPGGLDVAVEEQAGYREEKVDLPASWLRGFSQLQGAMGLPMRRVPLSREAVYSLLAFLRRHKARRSPRAVRFELSDGEAPRLVLEPWEQPILSHGTRYRGPDGAPVRIWGRRRLLTLARALPLCQRVEVFLLGTGLPSFWVLDLGEMRLVLGLSGWTTNDWTRASSLDLLAPPVKPGAGLLDRVARALQERRAMTLAEVISACLCAPAEGAAALNHLAHAGQVIFDLGAEVYRYRQVLPRALGEAEVGPESEELRTGRMLVYQGKVRLERREDAPRGGVLLAGTVDGKPVEALLDGDGLLRRARCVCSHFYKAGIRKGPCRHLLALRHVGLGQGGQPGALGSWYENLERGTV